MHLDLDVLDDSLGSFDEYPSPGGMLESDVWGCFLKMVPRSSLLSKWRYINGIAKRPKATAKRRISAYHRLTLPVATIESLP